MWQFLTDISQIPFTWLIVGTLIVLISNAIKKGKISYSGHGLSINVQEKERDIIRRQMTAVNVDLKAVIRMLPNDLNLDPMRTRIVVSAVEEVFQQTIIHNHIKDDKTYIELKQSEIYNTVLAETVNAYFMTEEFKMIINEFVEEEIKKLVRIRNTYD